MRLIACCAIAATIGLATVGSAQKPVPSMLNAFTVLLPIMEKCDTEFLSNNELMLRLGFTLLKESRREEDRYTIAGENGDDFRFAAAAGDLYLFRAMNKGIIREVSLAWGPATSPRMTSDVLSALIGKSISMDFLGRPDSIRVVLRADSSPRCLFKHFIIMDLNGQVTRTVVQTTFPAR